MSRIGKMPVPLPKEVKVASDPSRVEVTGPKGLLAYFHKGFRSPWMEERYLSIGPMT